VNSNPVISIPFGKLRADYARHEPALVIPTEARNERRGGISVSGLPELEIPRLRYTPLGMTGAGSKLTPLGMTMDVVEHVTRARTVRMPQTVRA
jgi:hypothetical protein